MYDANEIFILMVSSGVLLLTLILIKHIMLIPHWNILLVGFLLYYLCTVITVVEGFLLPDFLNFLEHLLRATFPAVVLLWCIRSCPSRGDGP